MANETAVREVIAVRGVNHHFGHKDNRKQVLFDNHLEVGAGEIVIMTGPSGSGKTTLLTLMGALRAVQEGSLTVLGRELLGLAPTAAVRHRRGIGFIFQAHNLFDALTARQNVMMALDLEAHDGSAKRRLAAAMLEQLGLGHRLDYRPRNLSGGQRQRVAIARALVNRPQLILADEPTAALDKSSTHDVIEMLERRAREDGATVVMVTHDSRILDVADRIVNMVDGQIVSDIRVDESIRVCEFLKKSSVFAALTPSQLSDVAAKMRRERHGAGTRVFAQGEPGHRFYLIGEGAVEVIVDERKVGELGVGDFFGEAALLTGEPRNATIRTTGAVLLYRLDKPDFQAALESSATFKEQLLDVFFQRGM